MSIDQSVNQPTNQSIHQYNQLISHINQSTNQSTSQSFIWSINWSINQSISQDYQTALLLFDAFVLKFNQPVNESFIQSFNQSVNQPINHMFLTPSRHYAAVWCINVTLVLFTAFVLKLKGFAYIFLQTLNIYLCMNLIDCTNIIHLGGSRLRVFCTCKCLPI